MGWQALRLRGAEADRFDQGRPWGGPRDLLRDTSQNGPLPAILQTAPGDPRSDAATPHLPQLLHGPTPAQRLAHAVDSLAFRFPGLSARTLLSPGRKVRLASLSILLVAMATHAGPLLQSLVLLLLALPFACTSLLRVYATAYFLTRRRPPAHAASRQMPAPARDVLPAYTILVPLHKEADVVRDLLAALRRLDYPVARLEILLLVEEHDTATRVALELVGLSANMHIITVPDGHPRTKPRALNYGLTFAHGDYIAVYDAEDAPEPGQLMMAMRAFRKRPGRLGCVQARLDIYTPPINFLSRQFTLEYMVLFHALLPAYQRLGVPIPLGGTSNHFPRAVLEEIGGWDPYNVTEDADLGMRLARRGYAIAMIGSTTWEEAPLNARQWLGQRSRWIKGWLQTCLVHTRNDARLLRDLGVRGFIGFHVIFAGMLVSALVHPWAYLLLGYQLATRAVWLGHPVTTESLLWSFCLCNVLASYGAAVLAGAAVAIKRKRYRLALSGLLTPFYWLLVSAAAYGAVFDLIRRPHHWIKTQHTGAGRHRLDRYGRPRS